MGFIKDSLDVKIFVLLVVIVAAMVSLVVVFQNNFKDINTRYQSKIEELNNTFEALVGAQANLNETIEDLEVQTIREGDLRDKYTDLKDNRDAIEAERRRLSAEVAQKTNQISLLTAEVASLESEIQDLNARVNRLQEENENLDQENNCLRGGGQNC